MADDLVISLLDVIVCLNYLYLFVSVLAAFVVSQLFLLLLDGFSRGFWCRIPSVVLVLMLLMFSCRLMLCSYCSLVVCFVYLAVALAIVTVFALVSLPLLVGDDTKRIQLSIRFSVVLRLFMMPRLIPCNLM